MSSVRVLVGTRKGVSFSPSTESVKSGTSASPTLPGWEIYHLKGSPLNPDRIYASQTKRLVWAAHPAFRRRRQDVGATGNKFVYDGEVGTHQWYDGTQHPWEFKRVWHLEPSLTDPDTVYAGVEDAAFFRSRWRADLAGASRAARARQGPLAARRRRHVPAHHPARSE